MRGTSKAPPSGSKSKFLKRLRTRIGVPAALIAVAVLALPGSASAFGLGEQEEFFAPTQPTKPLTLAEGPDGNVWYTNEGSTKIGSVTPAGVVTEYSPGLTGAALSITAGPEGTVWFTEKTSKKIGRIKASEPATSLQEFSVTNEPEFITEGPDGNLWFTSFTAGAKSIGRITPAGVVTEFSAGLNASSNPVSIIPGPDGNVWFGDIGTTKAIGKITPSGTITEYTVLASGTNRAHSIAFGSDERIWFAAQETTTKRIGALTTEGVATYYTTGEVSLNGFATGADGNVWARETTAANERQKISLKTSGPEDLGGTYKLEFEGQKTEPLAFNASNATVEAALGALSSIGGVANVKGIETFTGGALVERTIEFEGKLARTDVSAMICISSLTGTEASCSVAPATTAVPNRLFRFKASGEFTVFPLQPRTLGSALTTAGKMGTIVPGPDNSLWFTAKGDPSFVSTAAIGKFGLGIEKGPKLTVVTEGTGGGTVVSNPTGIECPVECVKEYEEGKQVTLTASPNSESLFVSWKGCETGGAVGRTCKVTMDKDKTVIAKFIKAYDVSVTRKGTGLGKIGSSPGGVLCLSNCSSTSAAFKEATNVTLTATPSKNFTFTGWSGDCSGVGTCVLSSLEADKAVEAEFTAVPQFNLTVTKSGGGNGTVKAKQAGINCGATCTSQAAAYYQGTEVELSVIPGKGSTFGGWSKTAGTCTGTTNPCKVTVSAAKEVQAEFK